MARWLQREGRGGHVRHAIATNYFTLQNCRMRIARTK